MIFGAGAGMPYFSTDTVAAQRALEIGAEVILMGKQGVDGVYDADPNRDSSAVKFDQLTYDEFLTRGSRSPTRPRSASAGQRIDGRVRPRRAGNIVRVVQGEKIGTMISRAPEREPRARPDGPEPPRTTHRQRGAPAVISETLSEADQKMDKAVEVTREEFAAIRTGRAHPSMFHKITADYYGTPDAAPAARVVHRPRGAGHHHQPLRP